MFSGLHNLRAKDSKQPLNITGKPNFLYLITAKYKKTPLNLNSVSRYIMMGFLVNQHFLGHRFMAVGQFYKVKTLRQIADGVRIVY